MGGGGSVSSSPTRAEALTVQSSTYGAVIPWLRGKHRVQPNLLWYGDWKATSHQQSQGGKGGGGGSSTSYTYSASMIMALCHGTVTSVGTVWKGKATTSLSGLGMTLLTGAVGQATWSGLTGKGVQAIGYSGIAAVAALNYNLGDSTSVENHSYEVAHSSAYSTLATTPDVDPAVFTADLLTDKLRGAGLPSGVLAAWTDWSNYCVANGLLMSPLLDTQVTAADALTAVSELTNTAIVWSGGVLKMRPYSDQAITANGRTFTPDTTPVYELDDSCYTPAEGDAPVIRALTTPADLYNSVSVEFHDRANSYNNGIVTAKDLTDISVNGVRQMDTIEAHWICEASVARLVAEIRKQRALLVSGTYTFTLPWHYALLECMDLLLINDSVLMLDDVPVRVIQIDEQSDEDLTVTAEDYPTGMASAPRYPVQATAGFAQNTLASPGSCLTPVIFELPAALTGGALQLGIAVAGTDPNWGGCEIWASWDGTNYQKLGDAEAASRYGTIQLDSGTTIALFTNAGQQLLSGSSSDLAALATLIYVQPAGGIPGEYLAYQTATLTGTNAYTLSVLNRGVYATPQPTHGGGTSWVRVDDAIWRTSQLDPGLIGKTIHIKCLAFNGWHAATQQLSAVAETTYTITGAYARQMSASSTLTILANRDSFAGTNYNEAYICGRDATGAPADVDGTILLNGQAVTVPKGPMYGGQGPASGFVVWDSAGATFTTTIAPRPYVIARRYQGAWQYDDNSAWVTFTPAATHYIIGTIEIGGVDTGAPGSPPGITAAVMWAAASTPSALTAAADAAYTAAAAAQTAATNAQNSANTALGVLSTMRSNGYLDASEKPAVSKEWQAIAGEKTGIDAQATALGITTEKTAYDSAYDSLAAYLTALSPAWYDTTTDTPIVPATDLAQWTGYYTARQTLLNKIAAVAATQANWTGVAGRPKSYRVGAYGLSATGYPIGSQLIDADTSTTIVSGGPMYRVVKINRTTKVATDLGAFNPLSGALGALGECNAMAAALNGIDSSHICVVFSYDEPATNRRLGNLPAAMYRNGASRAVWGSDAFRFRGAYIMVGIGGCGEGNGAENYAGAVDSDTGAWCDTTFQITDNGALIVNGASRGATTLLDYGYVGSLAATQNQVFFQDTDPTVSPGGVNDGAIWISSTKSRQRVGGTWQPYVGNGSVGTSQLVNNSATSIWQDTWDFAGASTAAAPSVVQRSITVTPTADCIVDFSASIVATSVLPDAGNFLSWAVSAGGGADVTLGSCNSNTSGARQAYSALTSFSAVSGVSLTFKLISGRASGNPAMLLYASSMRIEGIYR